MKVALVTGADGGMGRPICRALLQQGYSLVMACLSKEAAMPFFKELQAQVAQGTHSEETQRVWLGQLDLASFASIDRFVDGLSDQGVPFALHRLVHNAGVLPKHTYLTADGLEMIAQVNFAAAFRLTGRLLPRLAQGAREAEGARVMFTVSCTVYFGLFSRLGPRFLTRVPTTWAGRVVRYGDSKRAIYLASRHLAEDLEPYQIQVVSTDPGAVDTPMITMNNGLDPLVNKLFRPLLSTPEQGAATAIYLATASAYALPDAHGGTYLHRKRRTFYVPISGKRPLWAAPFLSYCQKSLGADSESSSPAHTFPRETNT